MDKAKIDRINYLARKSRERELTTEEKEEQLELRNEYRASFKRGLMSELDRVYVIDDKGKQQKLIKDNENHSSPTLIGRIPPCPSAVYSLHQVSSH